MTAKAHKNKTAIKAGVRAIDCAYVYGNQKEIGETFKKMFDDGVVKREELFVTSKISAKMMAPDAMEDCMQETLRDLQLEYVDLMLIHHPVGVVPKAEGSDELKVDRRHSTQQRWAKMEDFHKRGLAKAVGVSNYQVQLLSDVLATCTIKPAVNQNAYNQYCR